jgi:hypothetical protein
VIKIKNTEIIGEVDFPSDNKFHKISDKQLKKAIKAFATELVLRNRILETLSDAMYLVEAQDKRVSDIVVSAQIYTELRKYCKDMIDINTFAIELKHGFFGLIFGARLWVQKSATNISCYQENSKELNKKFPFITKAKKLLKIVD